MVVYWVWSKRKAKMRRLSGPALVAIGVGHTVVGVTLGYSPLAEIARDGFFNAVEPHFSRMAVFWFLFSGLAVILLGQLVLWTERRLDRPVPAFIGWQLLALSIVTAVFIPVSGAYLVIILALYMIVVARRAANHRASAI
jgi:hypothetical protein